MAIRLLDAFSQYFSDGGEVLTDGQVRFLVSGTNDLLDTYSDINLANPNANPLPLLAGGRVPSCFGQNRYYKVRLEYTDGTLIQEFDPVGGPAAEGEFGVWGNATVYNQDQIVYYSSKFWRSLADGNQGNEPGVDTGWAEIKFIEVFDATVTYPLNFIAQYNGTIYRSTQAANLNKTPSTEFNWWQRIDNIPVWGTTATFLQYDVAIGSDGISYISQQNANTNHNPVGDSGTWWKPAWQSIPPLTTVNKVSGGGTLLAYYDNMLMDGNSGYLLPLANTVPANGYIVISKSDIARTLYPTVTRSGSDTIAYLGGTDTSFQIDNAWTDTMILFSNGSNQWSF